MQKKLTKKTVIILAVVIVVLIVAGISIFSSIKKKAGAAFEEIRTEVGVERRNIVNTISGTSTIEANDSYEITSLVSGEVIFAEFEKDDEVEKDQVLYQIDSSDTERSLTNAQNALKRAENSYKNAVQSVDDLTVKTKYSGRISSLSCEKGDDVNSGMIIAEVYDDTYLEITVPFTEVDANNIYKGQAATVKVAGSSYNVYGTVTKTMETSYISSSRVKLKDVTVKITNPGALSETDSGTVEINGMMCSDVGTFKYLTNKNIISKASGEISSLYVKEGDYVIAGQAIALIKNDSVTDNLKNASMSLEDAVLSYESAEDRVDDYIIKAPISGKVVEKNTKAGDKLDSSKMTQTPMAIIYDMSVLKFDLAIDETDIAKCRVGQSVSISADAIPGKAYNGVVTNVSVVGTTNNGITTYPVTVEISEFDEDLKPGMNIEAVINIESATNVIAIPIGALNRGNTVYVKGEKEDKKDNAPDGFKTVKVEIGISDGEYVEIKKGLNEGDVIEMVTYVSSENENNMMPVMRPGNMQGGMGGMPSGGMPSGRMPSGGMPGGEMPGGGMR